MRIAITRAVSPHFNECEITHIERTPIDVNIARAQHHGYVKALKQLGCASNGTSRRRLTCPTRSLSKIQLLSCRKQRSSLDPELILENLRLNPSSKLYPLTKKLDPHPDACHH